jgi:hypothetical protein
MKKKLLILLLITFTLLVYGCSESVKADSEAVAKEYFEASFKADPDTLDQYYSKLMPMRYYAFGYIDRKNYIHEYIDTKFEGTLTEKFIRDYAIESGRLFYAPEVAKSQNANTSLEEVTLKLVKEEYGDVFFNFDATVKIDYNYRDKDDFGNAKGQLLLTLVDDKYEVDGITFFSTEFMEYSVEDARNVALDYFITTFDGAPDKLEGLDAITLSNAYEDIYALVDEIYGNNITKKFLSYSANIAVHKENIYLLPAQRIAKSQNANVSLNELILEKKLDDGYYIYGFKGNIKMEDAEDNNKVKYGIISGDIKVIYEHGVPKVDEVRYSYFDFKEIVN